MHYGNTENEGLEIRVSMLEKFEVRLFELMTFLNAKELIGVLYCYVKMGQGSE